MIRGLGLCQENITQMYEAFFVLCSFDNVWPHPRHVSLQGFHFSVFENKCVFCISVNTLHLLSHPIVNRILRQRNNCFTDFSHILVTQKFLHSFLTNNDSNIYIHSNCQPNFITQPLSYTQHTSQRKNAS